MNISKLADQIKDYKIVGLGEGSHELNKNSTQKILKLSKELITKYNYKVFLLESDFLSGILIDLYIKNIINLQKKELISLIMPVFRRTSILKFIYWLKKYNKNNNNKVTFIGANSETWIETYDLKLFSKCDKFKHILPLLQKYKYFVETINKFCMPYFKIYYGVKYLKKFGRYTNKTAIKLNKLLICIMNKEIKKFEIKNEFEKKIIDYLKYNIHISEKYGNQDLRDKYTYKLISEYMKNKSIIFYHNGHLVLSNSNSLKPLGYWLNKKYNYFSILYAIYNDKYKNKYMNDKYQFNKIGKYNNKIYFDNNNKYEIKYNGNIYVIKDTEIKYI